MLNLLKTEWLKIKNYTGFTLLASFFALGVVASNVIVYIFKKEVLDQVPASELLFTGSLFDFNMVWKTVSYYSSFFLMLPAMLLVILMANEFTFKTHRQNIIDGWSRFEFLKVKMGLAVVFAAASTAVVILTALGFGIGSGSSFSVKGFENIGYFFLKALSYNMVALLISLLTKRPGVAIALFFIYTIFENGVSMMLFFLGIKIKKEASLDFGNMGNYLPMNASDGLLTSPFEQFSGITKSFLPSDFHWLVFGIAIAYLLLFYWWSRRKILRSDL